jgi:hypothetical protein
MLLCLKEILPCLATLKYLILKMFFVKKLELFMLETYKFYLQNKIYKYCSFKVLFNNHFCQSFQPKLIFYQNYPFKSYTSIISKSFMLDR